MAFAFLAEGFSDFNLHIRNILYISAQQTPSSLIEGAYSDYNVTTMTDIDFDVTSTMGVNNPQTLFSKWSKWMRRPQLGPTLLQSIAK